jgi:hypothetical protein
VVKLNLNTGCIVGCSFNKTSQETRGAPLVKIKGEEIRRGTWVGRLVGEFFDKRKRKRKRGIYLRKGKMNLWI